MNPIAMAIISDFPFEPNMYYPSKAMTATSEHSGVHMSAEVDSQILSYNSLQLGPNILTKLISVPYFRRLALEWVMK